MEFSFVLEVTSVTVVVLEVFEGPIAISNFYPLLILFGREGPSSLGVKAVSAGRVNLSH